jgi:hypothetical protein
VIAVIDSGYDDGTNPGDHHPDLENRDRLDGLAGYDAFNNDTGGHGTMVAGIVAGYGGAAGSGTKDALNFEYGTGVNPSARVYEYEVQNHFALPLFRYDQIALNWSRMRIENGTNPPPYARAYVANESWNENGTPILKPDGKSYPRPKAEYTPLAQFFDARVLDASAPADAQDATAVAGDQPMSIVFSAGNHAYLCYDGTVSPDSVSSPAVGKNVIVVGATESIRPVSGGPPIACRPCYNALGNPTGRPPELDATNANRIANFSGRGKTFAP